MNIEKLEVGQIFKNYKKLCEFIELEPASGGRNLKLQKRELDRFFSYSKEGQKIIIDEVFEIEDIKIDRRSSDARATYLQDIQRLVLYSLRELDGEIGYVPVGRLLYLCEMVNSYYIEHSYDKKTLAKKLNVDISYVEEFYSRNHRTLRELMERTLSSMEKKSLIEVDYMTFAKVRVIRKNLKGEDYVDFEHRLVLDDELKEVIRIRENVMNELGYKNLREVHLKKKFPRYKKLLQEELMSSLGFYYTYKCYRIAPYKNRVISAIEEVEKDIIADNLSNKIIAKIEKDSISIHEKHGTKTFGKSGNIQSNIDYCPNIKKIAEYVVKHNYFSLDKHYVNTDVYQDIKLMDFNEILKLKNKKKEM